MKKRIDAAVMRHNVLLLLLSLLILSSAILIAVDSTIPYFRAKFGGGTLFRANEVTTYSGELPVYFAEIDGEEMIDTGYYKGSDHFGALALNGRFLLVELPSEVSETQTRYTGTLYALSREYRNEVVAQIESEIPEIRGAFLPYHLSVVEVERGLTYRYLGAFVLAAVVIACMYGLYLGVTRILQPARHPYWKRLRRYNADAEQLLRSVDNELLMNSTRVGNLTLTSNWIIQDHVLDFNLMRIEDVVWLYMHIQRASVYFVPVSKVTTAFIWDQYGVKIEARAKQAKVQEMLETIAFRARGAVLGYTSEFQKLWKKDRAAFVREVSVRTKQARQD